jgi:hypothetical protein
MKLGALFSDDRLYRYSLYRLWNDAAPTMVFVLLNPSMADERRDDPTIKRCVARAMNAGCGGIEVVNLFAWQSPYPTNLFHAADPVGPRNNMAIVEAVTRAEMVICGWGVYGSLFDRGKEVLGLIRVTGRTPHALKLNADGSPRHPLYLSYKLRPFPIP